MGIKAYCFRKLLHPFTKITKHLRIYEHICFISSWFYVSLLTPFRRFCISWVLTLEVPSLPDMLSLQTKPGRYVMQQGYCFLSKPSITICRPQTAIEPQIFVQGEEKKWSGVLPPPLGKFHFLSLIPWLARKLIWLIIARLVEHMPTEVPYSHLCWLSLSFALPRYVILHRTS